MQQRIQKIIAARGFASRRKAEELIQQGRFRVNGESYFPQRHSVSSNEWPVPAEVEYDFYDKELDRSGPLAPRGGAA